jgi:hypothetical protein
MSQYIRESILQSDLHSYYEIGWSYVMPDFGNADHYVIEWRSSTAPLYPNRVPKNSSQESADAGSGTGA